MIIIKTIKNENKSWKVPNLEFEMFGERMWELKRWENVFTCDNRLDSSACFIIVSMAFISACICLNSSTCAIFSCWRSSSSLLYSSKHLSSSSNWATSHRREIRVFSRQIVFVRMSLSASSLAKACLSSTPAILTIYCTNLRKRRFTLFLVKALGETEERGLGPGAGSSRIMNSHWSIITCSWSLISRYKQVSAPELASHWSRDSAYWVFNLW